MSLFNKALLLAALAATTSVHAKKGKMFEADAFVTPKSNSANREEPYLQQNKQNVLMNLRQTNEVEGHDPEDWQHDLWRTIVTGGQEDVDTHIITTSDINNYFNL